MENRGLISQGSLEGNIVIFLILKAADMILQDLEIQGVLLILEVIVEYFFPITSMREDCIERPHFQIIVILKAEWNVLQLSTRMTRSKKVQLICATNRSI